MTHSRDISLPELDACLEKRVRVYESTIDGEKPIYCKIKSIHYPWDMDVYVGESDIGPRGTFLTFAGGEAGITRIEKDGITIYENKKIPVPYNLFNAFTDDGLKAMNDLRRECFGIGFDYTKD